MAESKQPLTDNVFPPTLRQSHATEEPAEQQGTVAEPDLPPSYDDAMDAGASPRSSVIQGVGTLPRQQETEQQVALVRPSNDLSEPLTHVDFADGPFSSQVQRANIWLQQNRQVRVVSCETLELPRDNDGVSFGTSASVTDRPCFNLRVASNVQFIRIFRLWVVPKMPGQEMAPQQLNYVDIIPKRIPAKAKMIGKEKFKFENLQDSILRFNETIRAEPLPGRIISVQTCEVRFRDRHPPEFEKFDENYFTWVREEKNSPSYYYLTFLRVFHEMSPFDNTHGCMQQLGIADFAAKQTEGKSNKDFEQLQQPACRIQNWINENQDKIVVGVQTIDHKFNKSPGSKFEPDLVSTLLKETDTGDIRHLSVLRVSFIQYLDPSAMLGLVPLTLTYRTFCPEKTSREHKSNPPTYETMSETWKRVLAWLRVTGAPIMSAETSFLRVYPGKNVNYSDHEATFVDDRSDWVEFWLVVVRVYFNGTYAEPPAHLLPLCPRLPPEETSSCAIM